MAKNILKPFLERQYESLLEEVGYSCYRIFEENEAIPGDLFKKALSFDHYNCVVAATGSTLTNFECRYQTSQLLSKITDSEIVIPQNANVIVVRILTYDDNRKEPHYNAHDQLIFPTQKGEIFRVSREDAVDHYIALTNAAQLISVANAYKLPKEKSGPAHLYSINGASLPIKINPLIRKADE